MSALDWFAEDFSGGVRNRGREYYRGRTVTITKADDHQIVANVRGGQRYTVHIEWDDDVLRDSGDVAYDCTCPYFRDNDEPCKHIWATLLTADAAGQLPGVPGAAGANGDGDEESDEDDDFDGPPVVIGSIHPDRLTRGAPRRHSKGPEWKQQLAELGDRMSTPSPFEMASP